MSIIIPSDVVIMGDFSESNPIPSGSLLGVFFYDQNNPSSTTLLCGGIIEYINDDISYGLIAIGEKLGLKSTDSFGNSLNPDSLINNVPDWFIFGWPEAHEI